MVVKPGIAIVALPASGRGRNGPLFCRCSDRELRSRPASKGRAPAPRTRSRFTPAAAANTSWPLRCSTGSVEEVAGPASAATSRSINRPVCAALLFRQHSHRSDQSSLPDRAESSSLAETAASATMEKRPQLAMKVPRSFRSSRLIGANPAFARCRFTSRRSTPPIVRRDHLPMLLSADEAGVSSGQAGLDAPDASLSSAPGSAGSKCCIARVMPQPGVWPGCRRSSDVGTRGACVETTSFPRLRGPSERRVAPSRGARDRMRVALSRAAALSRQVRLSTIHRLQATLSFRPGTVVAAS
jgi:hypothetical protein